MNVRYKRGLKLAGILYLHRMTDLRISGSALKNLHVFSGLCGMEKMPTVVLMTTFWGGVEEDIGATREAELKATFWKDMLENGCTTRRFDGGYQAAWDILGHLLSREPTLLLPKKKSAATKHRSVPKRLEADQKRASYQLPVLVDQSNRGPDSIEQCGIVL
jgi:hypothetical protein